MLLQKAKKIDNNFFFQMKRLDVWKQTSQGCWWPTDLIHAQLDLEPGSCSTKCLRPVFVNPPRKLDGCLAQIIHIWYQEYPMNLYLMCFMLLLQNEGTDDTKLSGRE